MPKLKRKSDYYGITDHAWRRFWPQVVGTVPLRQRRQSRRVNRRKISPLNEILFHKITNDLPF